MERPFRPGVVTVNSLEIINAYNEISFWRKKIFGREFIDQLTKHINDWNNRMESQHVTLKAAFVLLVLGLQKSSQKSKARDHEECLAKEVSTMERW